jgi:SAM-dependent methyltransferase
MNKAHLEYCAGPEWRDVVQQHVIPWATGGIDLGDHLLEAGPGPGATTDILAAMVPKLTAIEIDEDLAAQLTARFEGTHVMVQRGDATAMPFADGTFSSAICLTMLHHLPDAAAQDRLFAEFNRVVRPGGWVIGSDNLDSDEFRAFHEGDTCTPIDPGGLEARLRAAGFSEVAVTTNPFAMKFCARAKAP